MAQIVPHTPQIVKDLIFQNNSLDNPTPICQELLARKAISPDFSKLSFEDYVPVFVYGTLKSGGLRNDVLDGCPYLGEARTATSTFILKDFEGNFPVAFSALDPRKNTDAKYIYGEVYAVPPRVLLELDMIESNGSMYQREEKFMFLMEQSYSTRHGSARPSIKAWMYLGVKDFWSDWENMKSCPTVSVTSSKGVSRAYEFPVGDSATRYPLDGLFSSEVSDDDDTWDEYEDFRQRIPF